MDIGALGKEFDDGAQIIKQGDPGDCMFVVQQGQLEVLAKGPEGDVVLAVLERGDVFGEMALFTKANRSATVRAKGKSRVLTIDKRGFFKRMHEDPTLAFQILKKMAQRIQKLNEDLVGLKGHVGQAPPSS